MSNPSRPPRNLLKFKLLTSYLNIRKIYLKKKMFDNLFIRSILRAFRRRVQGCTVVGTSKTFVYKNHLFLLFMKNCIKSLYQDYKPFDNSPESLRSRYFIRVFGFFVSDFGQYLNNYCASQPVENSRFIIIIK